MNLALIFDPDHPEISGYYGHKIKRLVFSTQVLQNLKCISNIMIGDILPPREAYKNVDLLTKKLFPDGSFQGFRDNFLPLFSQKYLATFVIENIDHSSAEKMVSVLSSNDSFLGYQELDWQNLFQLQIFRNHLFKKYRFSYGEGKILYSMGNEDSIDKSEEDLLTEFGFKNVTHIDNGARSTFFDDFDSAKHFRKVAAFRNMVSGYDGMGKHNADDIEILLANLNPALFQALGSAAIALERLEDKEDIAQVGLSLRRYIEQLADTFFPPRSEKYKGRDVGKGKSKNQLWAYVADTPEIDESEVHRVGKLIDKVIEDSSAVLHDNYGDQTERLKRLIFDLAYLSQELIALNPEEADKPYFAFSQNIDKMLNRLVERQVSTKHREES